MTHSRHSCMQVQAIPAQCAAVAELWVAWSRLSQPPVSPSRDTHDLLTSSFVACCSSTIAVVKMALQVLPCCHVCRRMCLAEGSVGARSGVCGCRYVYVPAVSGHTIRAAHAGTLHVSSIVDMHTRIYSIHAGGTWYPY